MTDRRSFLKLGMTAAIGSAIIPSVNLWAAAESGIVIGHGRFKYKVDKQWGLLDPSTHPVKDCHEMALSKQKHIYMFGNETRNNMLVYNLDGKLVDSWGTRFKGGHGCTLVDEGDGEYLYLTDPSLRKWFKTDLKGNVLMEMSAPLAGGLYKSPDEFKPTETAINPANGDIYVADGYGKDYILVYDANGQLKNTFGGKGPEEKHLQNAHGVCFDTRDPKKPVVLVTSRNDNKLKVFTLEGVHLKTINLPGAFICRPVIKGKYLYFAVLINKLPWTSGTGFVTILDKDFKVVSSPGALAPAYSNGQLMPYQEDPATADVFIHPHDVLVDADENLYVTQWNSGKTYPFRLVRV